MAQQPPKGGFYASMLDDVYVVMPNQLGLDQFDLEDALGSEKEKSTTVFW